MNDIGKNTFTGGESLSGLAGIYHTIMMFNELEEGKGAYEISFSTGKSGLSFGGNQMDLHENKHAREVFIEILNNAKDEAGNYFFSKKEVQMFLDNKSLIKQAAPEIVFGNSLSRINAALSSTYGREAINAAYLIEIKKGAQRIEDAIQAMKNSAARKFYDTDFGRALLFDYHNQYNMELTGRFIKNYIDGKYYKLTKTNFTTKKEIVAPDGIYTLQDHKVYIESTKQWYRERNDCERRLINIENIINLYTSPSNKISTLKSFGLTWDQDKKRWQATLPLPFTQKWFYPHNFQEQIFADHFRYSLPDGFIPVQNTFYYDAETNRLFFANETFPKILMPFTWVKASQVILEIPDYKKYAYTPVKPPMRNQEIIMGRIYNNKVSLWTITGHDTGPKPEKLMQMIIFLSDIYNRIVENKTGILEIDPQENVLFEILSFSDHMKKQAIISSVTVTN